MLKAGESLWPSAEERFAINTSRPNGDDGCWLWTPGTKREDGFAVFSVGNRSILVHRWVYQHFVSEITPKSKVVVQSCGNRLCMNPAHMQLMTKKESFASYRRPMEDRFWEKTRRGEDPSACWEWLAHIDPAGYARMGGEGREIVYVHRWSYEHFVGPIAPGLVIDHVCRVRHCVNPSHLRAVTQKVNTLAGVGPSAREAKQTHCKNGHELNAENTYHRRGKRECRLCSIERGRRRRAK